MAQTRKKYKPLKHPRYLPGQANNDEIKSDWNAYNQHRYNLSIATHRIDIKPLRMNPNSCVNSQRMLSDSLRVEQINYENKQLLKKLNKIVLFGGSVDTFNPHAYSRNSNWRSHELKMIDLFHQNQSFYDRVNSAKSIYPTKLYDKHWKDVLQKLHYSTKFPFTIVPDESLDARIRKQPSISNGEFVERPKCFIDFRVKNGVYLGRIVIELYHDYVPVTVQNFMSICCNQDGLSYKNCNVHRICPGRYIETGDITKGTGKGGTSIYGKTFDEENHVLKHTKMGVLSMVPVKPNCNNSQFSISLVESKEFDGIRVVFGKVIKGNTTLCKLNDMGRKFGGPLPPVIIYDCGEFLKGKTPAFIRNFKLV